VVQIHAIRKNGSGYWFMSLLALRGRPLALIPMLVYTLYVVFIVCYLQNHRDWVESSRQVAVWSDLRTALSLVGVALFFLQTFRTNNSYRVWADGRKELGVFLAEIDSIISFVAGGAIQSRFYSKRVLRWCASMTEVVKCELRGEDCMVSVELLLTPSELQELKEVPGHIRWLYCSQKIQDLWLAAYNDQLLGMNLHKSFPHILGKIHIAVAAMFRIQSTPMPFAYVTHLRSFL
jgi:predicted membrane chloride channel (bestrophin family)